MLIVDDDLLVLTGTAALIEDLGHVAIEVPSAAEALAVLASGEAIDVIVTDHAMPNMTGLQLAHSRAGEISGTADRPGDGLRRAAGRSRRCSAS